MRFLPLVIVVVELTSVVLVDVLLLLAVLYDVRILCYTCFRSMIYSLGLACVVPHLLARLSLQLCIGIGIGFGIGTNIGIGFGVGFVVATCYILLLSQRGTHDKSVGCDDSSIPACLPARVIHSWLFG